MQDITSDHSCPSIIYRILTKKIFATLYHEKFVKKKSVLLINMIYVAILFNATVWRSYKNCKNKKFNLMILLIRIKKPEVELSKHLMVCLSK